MRFALVEDSREWSEPGPVRKDTGSTVHAEAVEAEAWRRKRAVGLDEFRMREYVTGQPVPEQINQLCRQIELAAAALMLLSPIPADYRDNIYWPRVW